MFNSSIVAQNLIILMFAGMPHIHGVAWISKDYLDSIGICGRLCDFPEQAAKLADSLISCHISSDDEVLNVIAKEVQNHNHSKSCKKYGPNCRYGFPRLPSRKTLIAAPLPDTLDENEKNLKIERAKKILTSAKDLLEDPELDDDMSFDDYLSKIGVTDEEYHDAISIMEKGFQLILKRSIKERFVNNFNPEWLKAWNANIDVQHSVIYSSYFCLRLLSFVRNHIHLHIWLYIFLLEKCVSKDLNWAFFFCNLCKHQHP